jgi:glycine betaine/choline ABC-type transport system substrate-binding protein
VPRRTLLITLLLAILAGVAGCGGGDPAVEGQGDGNLIRHNGDNASKPPVTIGSKNFTEEYILAEIYVQALQAAGYRVRKQLDVGPELVAFAAVKAGRIDAYPEYTGTALTTFFNVMARDVPKSPRAAYELARRRFEAIGLSALEPTPFTDSNGFAMTQEGARQAGNVTKLSQLKGRASMLTLSGSPQCAKRLDCKLGLEQVYGLKFKRFRAVPLTERHDVLKKGLADVSVVFTTDGRIRAENLVLLQDDLRLLPPYNATLVTRTAVLERSGPDFRQVIEHVNKGLTTRVMQELNSRVDLDKQGPAAVAGQYLSEGGYITAP